MPGESPRALIALFAVLLLIALGVLYGTLPDAKEHTPDAPAHDDGSPGMAPPFPEEATTEGAPGRTDIQIRDDDWTDGEPYTPWREETVPVRVLSAVDGSPLPGVEARITRKYIGEDDVDDPAREGATDADGRVLLSGCGGAVELMCRLPGYHVHFVEMDGFSEELVVRLRPGTPLHGKVVFADSGLPVAGARVIPWPEAAWWERKVDRVLITAEDGTFTVAAMPPDLAVKFGVAADGYGSRILRRTPDEVTDPFVIEIGAGAVIRGRVLDTDGRGVAGAELCVGEVGGDHPFEDPEWDMVRNLGTLQVVTLRTRTVSAADGTYRISGLASPGGYVVYARDETGLQARSASLAVQNPADTIDCDVVLANLGTIVPRVVAEGYDPQEVIDDARITRGGAWGHVPEHQQASFLEDGDTWALTDVPPGEHDVYFEPKDHLPMRKRVTVKAGERVEVVFELDPGLILTGTLVDPKGRPVAGYVSWYAELDGLYYGNRDEAGEDGRFRILALPNAPGTLRASPEGHVSREIANVRPGGDAGRIVVERSPRVIGRLVGVEEPGNATGGIREADGGGSSGGRDVGTDGRFEFGDIRPGIATEIYLKVGDRPAYVKRGIVLKAGEVLDLGEVSFPEPITASGVVLDAGGKPVPWAHVRLDDWFQDATATTDALGRFELTGLTPGRSSIVVEVADIPRAFETVELIPDGDPIEITIPRQGTILCQVRDVAGQPVAGTAFTLTPIGSDGEPDEARHSHHWTDSAGRLLIPAVPGIYSLSATGEHVLVKPCPKITVTDGNDAELTLTVR